MTPLRRARLDPSMRAVLRELTPLRYAAGEDLASDRPGHVRAASAVRRWAGRLVLVQDDINVLALRDDAGHVEPRLLPWGEGRRRTFDDTLGNKHAKLDLPAFVAWLDGRGPLPALQRVTQYDLGRVQGVRLGFTDAAALPDGRVAFIAVAEASPDVVRDGEVVGCRFGVIAGDDVRTCDVTDATGLPVRLKPEGLEPIADGGSDGDPRRLWVAVDMDRPDQPAMLGELHVAWE